MLLIEICDLVCVLIYRSAFNTSKVHMRVLVCVLVYQNMGVDIDATMCVDPCATIIII